jgi:chitinase
MRTAITRKMLLSFILVAVILACQLWGTDVYAARDKQAPTAPANLTAIKVTGTSVELAWSASTDNASVASYSIFMNSVLIGSSTTNAYTAAGLTPDTQYTFYVQAKDPTGNKSPISNLCTVTTEPQAPPPAIPYRVVGYYTSWSAYRDFTPDKIPYSQVTHINYAFANIGSDLLITLGDATIDLANFAKLRALKKYNPNLKLLISVGGWSWSGKFSDVALTDASRTAFAASCVDFIIQHGFDGVDIDWEYPVGGGLATNVTRPEDEQNFTLLLARLREMLDAQNAGYLLTIAAGAGQSYTENTELLKLFDYLDYANIMTYDIHGSWDKYTDFNAPLYADSTSLQAKWSVNDAVQLWLEKGVSPDKIVVGVPFYGRKYGAVKGSSTLNPGLYQTYGRCTTITYQEIRSSYLPNASYKYYLHNTALVPWLFNGSTFISYDDANSIQAKTAYVKGSGLGGVMVWELSQDFNSELISQVYDGLK